MGSSPVWIFRPLELPILRDKAITEDVVTKDKIAEEEDIHHTNLRNTEWIVKEDHDAGDNSHCERGLVSSPVWVLGPLELTILRDKVVDVLGSKQMELGWDKVHVEDWIRFFCINNGVTASVSGENDGMWQQSFPLQTIKCRPWRQTNLEKEVDWGLPNRTPGDVLDK